MTVNQLRLAMETAAAMHGGDAEVHVWLPGSRVTLASVMSFLKDGKVLIEGNLTPASVLADGPGEGR